MTPSRQLLVKSACWKILFHERESGGGGKKQGDQESQEFANQAEKLTEHSPGSQGYRERLRPAGKSCLCRLAKSMKSMSIS